MHILLSWLCFDDKYGDYKLLAREKNWIEVNKQCFYGYHFPSKYQINAPKNPFNNKFVTITKYRSNICSRKVKNLRGSC